jgi:methionyl-tRNA synthetase
MLAGHGSAIIATHVFRQVWRYFLLSNRPESADTDFKWADLAAKNNNELLANLGNFVNRALSFLAAKCAAPAIMLSCSSPPQFHATKG